MGIILHIDCYFEVFRPRLPRPSLSQSTVLILKHFVETPVFLCDAKLGTKGKTAQVRGGQSPGRKKEREMQSFGSQIGVRDLGRQSN